MFKNSQTRWLVTAIGAATLMLAITAPAGAWADVEGGRMDGNGQGSMPPVEVQTSQILSNVAHEGRLAERRLGAQGLPVYKSDVTSDFIPGVTDSTTGVMAEARKNAREALVVTGETFIPGVTDSTTGVMQQVAANARDQAFTRPDGSAGTTSVPPELRNRDHVIADKAEPVKPAIPYLSHGEGVDPSYGKTFIPGVTDSSTGVLTDVGANIEPPVAVTREVSDDGFNWSSDIVIGISAALLTALLMALGSFALVNQRRRRMVL